jgi:hypothetical protein
VSMRCVSLFLFFVFPIFTSSDTSLNTVEQSGSTQLPLLFRSLFPPGAVRYWYDVVPPYCASWFSACFLPYLASLTRVDSRSYPAPATLPPSLKENSLRDAWQAAAPLDALDLD